MARNFTTRKRAILAGVVCLVAADLALGYYSWQLTSVPLPTEEQFHKLEMQLKMREAPIARAQKIREDMPKTQKDCEKFETMLLPASSGYSSVTSELGQIAKKSGVSLQGTSCKPRAIPARGLTELAMESTIEGDYKGSGRNSFRPAAPPPKPTPPPDLNKEIPRPQLPAPPAFPPPLALPAEVGFYGFGPVPHGPSRRGFLTDGQEVYVVAEGET